MRTHPEHLAVTETGTTACSSAEEAIAHLERDLLARAGPLQVFMEVFRAALASKPITVPDPPKCDSLTDLDRERIRKSIEKQTRKEQKRNEQRERSAAGQRQ